MKTALDNIHHVVANEATKCPKAALEKHDWALNVMRHAFTSLDYVLVYRSVDRVSKILFK